MKLMCLALTCLFTINYCHCKSVADAASDNSANSTQLLDSTVNTTSANIQDPSTSDSTNAAGESEHQRKERKYQAKGNEHQPTAPTAEQPQQQYPVRVYNNVNNRSLNSHICTRATENYDCQFQGVTIREGESHEFIYGADKQYITFRESTLWHLPKTLIDAFPNVKLLNFNDLKITTIAIDAFTNAGNLEELYLEKNRLTDFPRGILVGARKLKTLVLTNNNIKSMTYSFRLNQNLNDLHINMNDLTELPTFEYITQMRNFNASHNKLKNINSNQFIKQIHIENIDLSYNQLENLVLQLASTNLQNVDINNNRLTLLDMPLSMEHLNVENNSLSTFVAGNECKLKSLKISYNKLKTEPSVSTCQSLEWLDLSNNLLESFVYLQAFSNLQTLSLAHNYLFEFSIDAKQRVSFALVSLDLSHNQLSFLSSLPLFTSLKELKLNDNKLISIHQNQLPKSLIHLFISNNQWKCDEVSKLKGLVQDTTNVCGNEFIKKQGVCCKNYNKAFNDVLNQEASEAHFHEHSNYDGLHKKCALKQIRPHNDNIEQILQLASEADRTKASVLEKIADTKNLTELSQKNLKTFEQKKVDSSKFKQSMTTAIENKRKMYHVTKEGLLSDKEMLSRVIKYVHERDDFNEDLLRRRQEETSNTNTIIEQKNQDKQQLSDVIQDTANEISKLKIQEKELKKQKDRLQAQINRNSPSIHGKTGKS